MTKTDLAVVAAVFRIRRLVPVVSTAVAPSLGRDAEVDEEPRQPLPHGGAPPVPSHGATIQQPVPTDQDRGPWSFPGVSQSGPLGDSRAGSGVPTAHT